MSSIIIDCVKSNQDLSMFVIKQWTRVYDMIYHLVRQARTAKVWINKIKQFTIILGEKTKEEKRGERNYEYK